MRKINIILWTLTISLLFACSNNTDRTNNNNDENNSSQSTNPGNNMSDSDYSQDSTGMSDTSQYNRNMPGRETGPEGLERRNNQNSNTDTTY